MTDSNDRLNNGSDGPVFSASPCETGRSPLQPRPLAETPNLPGLSLAQSHTLERVSAAKLRLESGQLHKPDVVQKAVDRLVRDIQSTQ